MPALDQINLVLFVFSLFLYIAKELCTFLYKTSRFMFFEGFSGKNHRVFFCFCLEKAGKRGCWKTAVYVPAKQTWHDSMVFCVRYRQLEMQEQSWYIPMWSGTLIRTGGFTGWEDVSTRGLKKSPKSKAMAVAEVEPHFTKFSSSFLTQSVKATFHFHLYQLELFLSKTGPALAWWQFICLMWCEQG